MNLLVVNLLAIFTTPIINCDGENIAREAGKTSFLIFLCVSCFWSKTTIYNMFPSNPVSFSHCCRRSGTRNYSKCPQYLLRFVNERRNKSWFGLFLCFFLSITVFFCWENIFFIVNHLSFKGKKRFFFIFLLLRYMKKYYLCQFFIPGHSLLYLTWIFAPRSREGRIFLIHRAAPGKIPQELSNDPCGNF